MNGNDSPAEVEARPISVSKLNAMARGAIEDGLGVLWVSGEVSNFTRAASGHCYFVLKDAQAQVRCTLFRNRAQSIKPLPSDGDEVEVRAVPSLYEARGEFQLNVETLRRGGLGRLFEAFERLKQKLRDEGLFDVARKRPLPSFPRRVGVITSPSGAALRDVLTTLRRRMPSIEVIIYPTPVQGAGAAASIALALARASQRAECDVLLLCRGGGSIEDLWSFNDEAVARAIVAASLPVVTGIGHETDFTIADFAADVRAPTPTGAAELVSPDLMQWRERWGALRQRWRRAGVRQLENRMQRLDTLARRLVHPGEQLRAQVRVLRLLRERLRRAAARGVGEAGRRLSVAFSAWHRSRPDTRRETLRLQQLHDMLATQMLRKRHALAARVERLAGTLQALDPERVLERGYAIVRGSQGDIVTDAGRLANDEVVDLQFARGHARARVERSGEDVD